MSKFAYLATPYIVHADTKKIGGLRLAFDIETDGLIAEAARIHCVVVADLDSDQIDQYGPNEIGAALAHLARADYLIGHNITGFDLPLLRRLHDWAPSSGCMIVDTLIAGRLILPNLVDLDDQAAAMGDPALGKLRGRYSLEAWGARLGIPKIGADIEDWSKWTPEMQARCVGDVVICKKLWQFLQPDGYSRQALELEHRVAVICNQITADGVPFDVDAAERLCQQWTERRSELEAQLSQQFPGTNLNSRAQIGVLLEARGWIPEKRTEKTNQPKIDDELLEVLPALYPEFAGLSEHYMIGRRLGQLYRGKQAWLKHVGADGRIHGGLIHIGTPHSRAKHLNPNLAQVPNPKRGKPLATECRALFQTNNDWVFVACDQSNLQDRGFAHYLASFDAGIYAKAFLEGNDQHWQSAAALGLIAEGLQRAKDNKIHTAIREGAKRFRYAFLYGCGAETAGRIIHDTVRGVQQIDPTNGLQQKFFGESGRPSEAVLKQTGRRALNRFEAATPGLQRLRESLKAHAQKHGWLPGLDGRRVPVRAFYTALNFIVTSSEAIICKRWLAQVYDELNLKFRYGWDGDVVLALWIHDELAVCCRPEIAGQVGDLMLRHAKESGKFYNFKVPLDAEFKSGRSWAGEVPPHEEPQQRPTAPDEPEEPVAQPEEPNNKKEEPPWNDPPPHENGCEKGNATYGGAKKQNGAKLEAIYTFRDAGGRNHQRELKWRNPDRTKSCAQQYFVNAQWTGKKPKGWITLPYRLPELLAAASKEPVYVAEGPKDAETLRVHGLIATTNAEGAGKFTEASRRFTSRKTTMTPGVHTCAKLRTHSPESCRRSASCPSPTCQQEKM